MAVIHSFDGLECPDCGSDRFKFTLNDDADGPFQDRECFECGAKWVWRPKPQEAKRRPGTAFAVLKPGVN